MWSIRQASAAGGISNTAWASFEAGKSGLAGRMRQAVAQAFGWDYDWPAGPPAQLRLVKSDVSLEELDAKLDAVLRLLEQLAIDVSELSDLANLADLE